MAKNAGGLIWPGQNWLVLVIEVVGFNEQIINMIKVGTDYIKLSQLRFDEDINLRNIPEIVKIRLGSLNWIFK